MNVILLAGLACLCSVAASAQVAAWPEGYWDRQYGVGQQWSVMYGVALKVESPVKAREKAVKILEQAGGRTAQNGYYGYGRPGATTQLAYLLPVAKAEKAAKQMLSLGDLQQYSTQKSGSSTQLGEIREKIASVENEQKSNASALESMPVARTLLASLLTRLTQSRDSAESSAETALINLTLIDAAAPEAQPPQIMRMEKRATKIGVPVPANEGAAKGSLGALRSSLSIFYGDTEGHYPSTLTELTVAGKYLSKIPRIQVAAHAETDTVTAVRGVSDLSALKSKLKDTGGWAYLSDPKSPQYGTVVIDCTHTDSRSTAWYSY